MSLCIHLCTLHHHLQNLTCLSSFSHLQWHLIYHPENKNLLICCLFEHVKLASKVTESTKSTNLHTIPKKKVGQWTVMYTDNLFHSSLSPTHLRVDLNHTNTHTHFSIPFPVEEDSGSNHISWLVDFLDMDASQSVQAEFHYSCRKLRTVISSLVHFLHTRPPTST